MGIEGFSTDSALLYHRHLPTAIVAARSGRRAASTRAPANHPLLPRHLRTPQARRRARPTPVTGRQLLMANDDVRIPYAVADRASPLYRNAIGDELRLRRVRRGARWRRCSARSTSGPATTCVLPDVDDAPLGAAPATSRCGRWWSRRPATSAPPRRYLSPRGPVPRARAVLRARPARARRAAAGRGRPTSRCSSGTGPGRDPLHVRAPPVRRGRLGRLPVPVRVQHHTTSSRSPAGCTSRRRCTRRSRGPGFVVCSFVPRLLTTTRWRSRCRTTTRTWTATRCSSTPAATS